MREDEDVVDFEERSDGSFSEMGDPEFVKTDGERRVVGFCCSETRKMEGGSFVEEGVADRGGK